METVRLYGFSRTVASGLFKAAVGFVLRWEISNKGVPSLIYPVHSTPSCRGKYHHGVDLVSREKAWLKDTCNSHHPLSMAHAIIVPEPKRAAIRISPRIRIPRLERRNIRPMTRRDPVAIIPADGLIEALAACRHVRLRHYVSFVYPERTGRC